ncbi:winged helix-turn-helix domain-containing protein [Yersinia ruckeri]|nr:winged helix-turn-helix domain-containing protein [Yersinia ruckeri]EKN4201398.1 winged helix-turn-helix domain-containing protein [Yersinia ruckeri]EKN4726030.1 winged helix-turn-helix domain-containing protein [Yersinia ruckeri]ELV7522110.1 winged helix-turn-helix domain-containing protein [Yersinia ruckeri]
MSHKIIFNNKVVYDHAIAALYNINNKSEMVFLTTPANHCLLIITNNRHEVVSQRTFFTEVWENHGAPINSNTFYQNISIIRRAFKQLGLTEDVIVTVPRRGVRIGSNIEISSFPPISGQTPESMVLIAKESAEVSKQDNEDTQYQEDVKNFTHNHSDNRIVEERGDFYYSGSNNSSFLRLVKTIPSIWDVNYHIVIAFIFLAIMAFSASVFDSYFYSKSRFYDYKSSFLLEQCDVFSQISRDIEIRKSVEHMIKINNISCQEPKRVYLSSFPALPRLSLIVCDGDILKSGTYCNSYYHSY